MFGSEAFEVFSESRDAIFALIGTGVGTVSTILITSFFDWGKEKKAIKKAGNDFNFHLYVLSEELQVQVAALDKYLDEAQDFKAHLLNINVFHSFDFISSLDKPRILEYYMSITTKESKTMYFLNQRFKYINSISLEVQNLKKTVNDYDNKIVEFEKRYNIELVKYVRNVRDYGDGLSTSGKKADKKAMFIINMIDTKKLYENKKYAQIIDLEQPVHSGIDESDIVTDKSHDLYTVVNNFNDEGHILISEFYNDTERHLKEFHLAANTIKNACNQIYEQNFVFKNKYKDPSEHKTLLQRIRSKI
jgi:hypothetical protein